MPDFWQFPTVSMGLGPIRRSTRRASSVPARACIANTEGRRVWCFCGDGEMDEPESLGAIGMAAREKLDNLIFVRQLQFAALDGPVRGNGKIVQELEGDFRGAGWNVLKVNLGLVLDPLLARDKDGWLLRLMEEQSTRVQTSRPTMAPSCASTFSASFPQTLEMVSRMTDADIWRLNRGGHDPHKIYAAYAAAVATSAKPTVILAKTVQGLRHGQDR